MSNQYVSILGLTLFGVVALVIYLVARRGNNLRSSAWTFFGVAIALGVLAVLFLPMGRMPSRTASVTVLTESQSGDAAVTHVQQIESHRTVGAPAPRQPAKQGPDDTESPLAHLSPAIKTIFAAAALVICLALAFLFLDAGRRGRYAWPLRFGTVIVFAGLCVLLWKIGPLM